LESNVGENLGHELKHYIDDNFPDLAKAFDDLWQRGQTEEGKAAFKEMAEKLELHENIRPEEFGAVAFGKIFTRPDTWKYYAEALENNTPGMGERFLHTIQEFIKAVKNRLAGMVKESPEAETFFNNVQELEKEAGRMIAELRRQNGNSNQVENVVGAKGNTNVETVPVSAINVDAKRFQFKSNTSKTSGVDEANKLGGNWDPRTAGNLYLWEDKDGKIFVVNGHHRLELAQRTGVENINAIIDRESDGVTAEQARRNGVLINIRDGQGEVRDYASFVRSEKLSEDEAKAQGVTARQKGRAGFLLGKSGDILYEAYINEVIPESKAVIIAEVANGNEGVEYAGIKLATDRKLAGEVLRQTLKLAKQNTSGNKVKSEQGSLFDTVDDSVLQEWESIGKVAAKHIKEIRTRIEAAKDAIKNPEAAKSLGVKTTKGAEKLLSQAQQELLRWENYATDPELMAELRKEAGIPEREVVSKTENTTDKDGQKPTETDNKETAEVKEEVVSAENAQTISADSVEEKQTEIAEPVVKENLTTETAATAGESSEVEKTPEVKSAYANLKDRSAEIGFTFEQFYEKFAPQLDAIIAKETNKFRTIGNENVGDWRSAAYEAMAEAYMGYNPDLGVKITTYATHAVKNAINDVNAKHKKETDNRGGRISLDQPTDSGSSFYDTITGDTNIKDTEFDTVSAREDKETFDRRAKEFYNSLSGQDKLIFKLHLERKAPYKIARTEGVYEKDTEKIKERIRDLMAAFTDEMGVMFSIKNVYTGSAADYDEHIQYSKKLKHQQINPVIVNGKVRDEYADLLDRKEYTPEKIAEWSGKAREWILKQGGIVNASLAMLNNKAPAEGHVAELARRLIINSDVFTQAIQKADRIKLYEQEIDARSEWGRTGRAMQLNALKLTDVASLQALLNKLNKDIPDEELIKLRNDIKDALDIDIYNLPNDIVKDKSKLDAILRMELAHKAKWHDKLYEYWVNSILSGPNTHITNLIGNTANAVYEMGLKRFVEAVVNTIAGKKDGATFGEFREMLHVMNWGNAWKAAKLSFDTELLDPAGKFLEHNSAAIGGKMGRFIRTPGRALKAADAFAKAIIQPMETAAYAFRIGVNNGLSGARLQKFIQDQITNKDSDAYAWGLERAKEITFQEDPGIFIKQLSAMRETDGFTGVALRYMLPFIKTPYNILGQGLRKSPFGILNLGWKTGEILSGKRKADAQYMGLVAEQLLAYGALMALYSLSSDDDDLPVITGANASYGSAEYGFKSNKLPANSIRIGKTWISYAKIEPLATGLAAIADGIQAIKDAKNGKSVTQAISDVLVKTGKVIADKSFIDSIGEIYDLVQDPERNLNKPVNNLLASAMPNIYRQIRHSLLDTVQDSKSREKGFEFLKEQFMIVGNRMGVTAAIPKIDYFGREVKKDAFGDTLLSAAGRLILPVKVQTGYSDMDKAETLVWNYNQRNPDEAWYPSIPRNTFTVNKKKLYLAGDDYRDYAVDAGKLAHRQINNAIRAGYLNVNNPGKKDIDLIKKIFTRARKETQQKYIRKAKEF
jgi:hypothetical protein